MALSRSDRIKLIKGIAKELASEEWPIIDLTLDQFGLPTESVWSGGAVDYVTPSLRKVLDHMDADVTPDNQGYYGFHQKYSIYWEVIDYNKLLRDAQKRNRIFFDKLNLLSTQKR